MFSINEVEAKLLTGEAYTLRVFVSSLSKDLFSEVPAEKLQIPKDLYDRYVIIAWMGEERPKNSTIRNTDFNCLLSKPNLKHENGEAVTIELWVK